MIVYGSGIADGNATHAMRTCQFWSRDEATGRSNRDVTCNTQGTPATNLWLTLLDRMDVHPETIGDSTGRLEHLTDL